MLNHRSDPASSLPTFVRLMSVLLVLSSLVLSTLSQASTASKHDLDTDILFLSDELKAILDKEIRPIRDKVDRAVVLHSLIFSPQGWAVKYSDSHTFTAQETYDQRKGNCMSLAALFVASARHVGLPAKFQTVDVPHTWTPKEGYFVVPGHINAMIRVSNKTINLDFMQTFFDLELKDVKKKRISDKLAFAEYHNNIAMELVEKKDFQTAQQHMELAIEYGPKVDFIWSNYGVLYKFMGDYAKAEEKYKKALKLNKRNFSALTNLYVLYSALGRHTEAEQLAAKVERYSRKNPYYLAKLAETALKNNNFDDALALTNKAIRKNNKVPSFYFLKARVFYKDGKHKQALDALIKARSLSEELEQKDSFELYNKKIQALISHL